MSIIIPKRTGVRSLRVRVPPRLLLSHISAAARRLIGRAHRKQYTAINPNQNPIKIFTYTYLSRVCMCVCVRSHAICPPRAHVRTRIIVLCDPLRGVHCRPGAVPVRCVNYAIGFCVSVCSTVCTIWLARVRLAHAHRMCLRAHSRQRIHYYNESRDHDGDGGGSAWRASSALNTRQLLCGQARARTACVRIN